MIFCVIFFLQTIYKKEFSGTFLHIYLTISKKFKYLNTIHTYELRFTEFDRNVGE